MSESTPQSGVRVALSHHWLVRERGGEKVLREFCRIWPQAPIYTLVHDAAHAGDGWPTVHESALARIPGARRHYQKLLPLFPWAARSVQIPDCDLVVCSDAALAKAMRVADAARLVCYCHSPMRYVWDLAEEYGRAIPAPLRPMWRMLGARLRRVDARAAERVDLFIANSRHVAQRIARAYGKPSVAIHPPVEVPQAPPPAVQSRAEHYICVGYHVGYKRLDLAVAACAALGRRLVVIGDGPQVASIRRTNPAHVEWRGWLNAGQIAAALREARGLLFPGEEDFGIVPVEALAHGCPVIAYGVGGVTESVVEGEHGVFCSQQTVESLTGAMVEFERRTFDSRSMHARAMQFSAELFRARMRAACDAVMRGAAGDLAEISRRIEEAAARGE